MTGSREAEGPLIPRYTGRIYAPGSLCSDAGVHWPPALGSPILGALCLLEGYGHFVKASSFLGDE